MSEVAVECPESSSETPPRKYQYPLQDPEIRARGPEASRLKRAQERQALELLESGQESPLPAGLQNQVIRRGAAIVLDAKTGIKEQVQALSAVAKLTERLDTSNEFATQELIDYFRSIPR